MALRSLSRKCCSPWTLRRHVYPVSGVVIDGCLVRREREGSSYNTANYSSFANFSTVSFDDYVNVVNSKSQPPLSRKDDIAALGLNNVIADASQTQLAHRQNQYEQEILRWMKASPKIAAYKVEEKLANMWVEQQELLSRFEQQHRVDESLQPPVLLTVDTVNLVIQAWCNSNTGEVGAMRAERLLRWMEDLHSTPAKSTIGLEPTSTYSYNTIFPMPDYQSYATVIDAWSRAAIYESGHAKSNIDSEMETPKRDISEATKNGFECARRAEDVLMHMQKMHERRLENQQHSDPYSSDIQPDTHVFHLVLKAWSNIRGATKATAMRATRILDFMQELHHFQSLNSPTSWQGISVFKVHPNVHTYKLLIQAWASTATPEGADHAEEILRHLLSISKAGNVGVESNPDEECFHIVMKAHAESVRKRRRGTTIGHTSSGDRARQVTALLDWMELLASRRAFKIQPTLETYRIAMSAWAWSHDVDAPREAERILFRIIRASEISCVDVAVDHLLQTGSQNKVSSTPKPWLDGPETRDFNTVINCCAFARGVSSDPSSDMDDDEALELHQKAQKEIFLIAEDVFQALLESKHAQPDSDTFLGMLRACVSLLPNNEDRDARVIELFRLAYKTHPPEQSSSSKSTYSVLDRLQSPIGGGCVNANILRQLRLALPSTEEYIRVREEYEQYRRNSMKP
ncbi:hypothetical protein HJC23_011269 [Cyclotella cryptica]|uniref:Uncharacterized protein n=1 Tax=Cyclotella cryptica TaxID=29204 RepID=A0ABD3QYX6_9STRA|eukprot:CCRYP_001642-RA/>CCRYP_001642-RA protein AED:0.03 eAED:-0.03 QI:0/-1/0/1/-1/1/1/0/687